MKTKTIMDFNKVVEKTIRKYSLSKMEYGNEYTTKSESYHKVRLFYICNHLTATKIIFDEEQGLIIIKEMIVNDVNIISGMLNDLTKEGI